MTARWRVRRTSGRTSTFESDVAIQLWILDGVLRPEDALWQGGEEWRPLGTIPEFGAFFAAAEAAKAPPMPPPEAALVPAPEVPTRRTARVTLGPSRRSRGRFALGATFFALALCVEWVGLFEREAASSILRLPDTLAGDPPRTTARPPSDGLCPTAIVARSACDRALPRRAGTRPTAVEAPREAPAEAPSTQAPPVARTPAQPPSPPISIPSGHGYYYYVTTGDRLRAENRCADAIVAYRRALDVRPGAAEPLGNVGECLLAQGDVAAATASFEAALRKNPFHRRSLRALERLREAQRGDEG